MPKPKFKPPIAPKSDTSALDLLIIGILMAAILPAIGGYLILVTDPVGFFADAKAYFAPFFDKNLWWLKIISVILSAFFLITTVYIIRKTNYFEIKREQFLNILGGKYLSRRRVLKAWAQIRRRLLSPQQNDWKLAILESDHVLNEILKMSGYLGTRLEDKLLLITPTQLSNIEDIKRAHEVRHKIANDPTFPITQKDAEDLVNIYKVAFKELNLIQE